MENEYNKAKNTFLNQWFTIIYKDKVENLLFTTYNNHYIQGWFENRGYTSFENNISDEDFDSLLYEIGEVLDDNDKDINNFEKYFPDKYIENYSFWNIEKIKYWQDKDYYKEHAKNEIINIYKKLIECVGDGDLKYNMYYPY